MANPWFRMYHEFADDPKVQMMPEAMQRRLVMLFCSKCKGETLHETEIAFHWRISEIELAETKSLFLQKYFIDEDWNLLNWNRRQFLSDSSTDRVRRFRQGKKQDETLQETDGTKEKRSVDATVTPPEQIQNRAEHKKPSRDKREPDARHAPFKEACSKYYEHHKLEMAWSASEGKQLSELLSANPSLTLPQFQDLLRHRSKSQVNHAERPRVWLGRATDYAAGPLDKFNKPVDPNNNPIPFKPVTLAEKMERQMAQA